MAHLNTIATGLFSNMAVTTDPALVPATYDDAGFKALFATVDTDLLGSTGGTGQFMLIPSVRDFPAMGATPNIVKVPMFGHKQSQQVRGQSDAPSLELTINYIASEWNTAAVDTTVNTALGSIVGDGKTRAFRFAVLAVDSTGATAATKYASLVAGLGTVPNSVWYWTGRIESLLVKPSLTDAATATLSLSMQSSFYGAYTY